MMVVADQEQSVIVWLHSYLVLLYLFLFVFGHLDHICNQTLSFMFCLSKLLTFINIVQVSGMPLIEWHTKCSAPRGTLYRFGARFATTAPIALIFFGNCSLKECPKAYTYLVLSCTL